MGEKRYSVPLVKQESSDTCWHASSQMIWWYWQGVSSREGPMNTLANPYKDNKAIGPMLWITLAIKVGLKEVPRSNAYSSDSLASLLTAHGPLWCAGKWYGPGHAIVLTGVSGETLYVNDPDGGVAKEGTVAWFNTMLYNSTPGCLLAKDPARY